MDATLLVALAPGIYTADVVTGQAMMEVYEVP